MRLTNRRLQAARKKLGVGDAQPSRAKEWICFGCGRLIVGTVFFVGRDRIPYHSECCPSPEGKPDGRVERHKGEKE